MLVLTVQDCIKVVRFHVSACINYSGLYYGVDSFM